MSRIAAVHGVLPPNRYAQAEITDAIARLGILDATERRVLERLHRHAQVEYRHLVLPLDDYVKLDGFGAANDVFVAAAVDLGSQAIAEALDAAGLTPRDVDMILFTTVTGLAAPSIEARIASRLGMRPDVKRLPLFGLGCVGGAAGVARVHDYLTAKSAQVAVLLSVEFCSLTIQRDDRSIANLVAGGLFGDGVTAVVATTSEGPGPRVVDSRSHLYPDSDQVMGWDITNGGFRVVLDASVPAVVRTYLPGDVDGFLGDHGLTRKDVTAWVCHPGGPRVLEAVVEALDLPPGALDVTWRSLAEVGNLSSSSVLRVLADTMALDPPKGTPGLMIAMGPGFCSELVLLEW
ncbi:3-oxoacyl-[acyl-carrier-protein] synthase III C-terminal domain-containing protein [Herbidospora sp. NBRC 101105]|uniref:type III polyketide synthase n=1 Tax=Herbidospora sp. NBRC 101105 TaxID=3032195 RepID=UPI0024A36E62|nr:3-oxoacyl-[acyl-carrier-protein] synthase III C-terminal domain-containing protein [Herbidospora sp. NBRC 101105]GLX96927.1 polyketide synthase [Herbidospora sp. NBRC 101105]